MAYPKIKISDNSGNTVAVDTSGASNALKVALVAGASVNIGDVELLGHTTFLTYPQFAVGTTLVQLSVGISYVSAVVKEMIIQADFDNTSFIMVGDDAILATEVDGIRINAGDTLTLPIRDTTAVYFRSDTADQKVNVSLIL